MHNMESLAYRRDVASANFLIKLINNKIDSPSLLSQVDFLVPRAGARYSNTFCIARAKTNALAKAPLTHMARNANKLCEDPFICH